MAVATKAHQKLGAQISELKKKLAKSEKENKQLRETVSQLGPQTRFKEGQVVWTPVVALKDTSIDDQYVTVLSLDDADEVNKHRSSSLDIPVEHVNDRAPEIVKNYKSVRAGVDLVGRVVLIPFSVTLHDEDKVSCKNPSIEKPFNIRTSELVAVSYK